MRLSLILFQQHAGRMFRRHWKIQGRKILRDNGALKSLTKAGIPYEDANDIVTEPPLEFKQPVDIVEETVVSPKLIDTTTFGDGNVLVGGLAQAQVFTNSVLFPSKWPYSDKVDDLPSSEQDKLIKRCIKSSLMYDAWQEKLPIRKDPERPAWNFPRDYGITDKRKNHLLCKRLLQFLSSSSPQLLAHRRILPNANFRVPVLRDGKTVILDSTADILVTSTRGIEPFNKQSDEDCTEIPSIAPLLQTVSIPTVATHENHTKFQSPLVTEMGKTHVHTAIVHFSPTQVANLYETPVTEDQILGRSLMKCFAFAVAQAKITYGEDVEDLPKPITVQCVQTDSREFHFSVFQLNTTKSYADTNLRNCVWSMPRMRLLEECAYLDGRPVLSGYNSSVIAALQAFYYNN